MVQKISERELWYQFNVMSRSDKFISGTHFSRELKIEMARKMAEKRQKDRQKIITKALR